LTQQTNWGKLTVVGTTTSAATNVTVNGQTPYRNSEYFRNQLSVTNTNAVWQTVTVASPTQNSVVGHAFVAQEPESFTYDADGNLTQDGGWTYGWDGENRLTNMTSLSSGPSGSLLKLNFTYDYLGRRIQKAVWTNNGSYVVEYTNRFVYDGWNLIAELNTAGGLIRGYLWGPDLSGSMQGAGGVGGLLEVSYRGSATTNGFIAYDGNGDVASLVNAADGTALANYIYGPFGEVIRATGPMAKLNPFRFSTKYDDDESDLLYYGYRYCSPSTGRWLNRDPMAERWGANLYCFNYQDPNDFIDPFGLAPTAPLPPGFNPVLSPTFTLPPPLWSPGPGNPILPSSTPPVGQPGTGEPTGGGPEPEIPGPEEGASSAGAAAGGLLEAVDRYNDAAKDRAKEHALSGCEKTAHSLSGSCYCCILKYTLSPLAPVGVGIGDRPYNYDSGDGSVIMVPCKSVKQSGILTSPPPRGDSLLIQYIPW
jgi:RHS repeat-associated protein